MASFKISMWVMLVVVLYMSTTTTITEAQDVMSCAQKLIPCQPDLNTTTTPSANCCTAIREAITNERDCLCNLYNDPSLLQSFGVNVTQAIKIAERCSINADLSSCLKAASPTPPPGVPGNDGSRMAWTGFSSFLLLLASSLFY